MTDAAGRATFTVEWTIPEEGIGVYAGDEQRKDHVTAILTTTATAELEVEVDEPEVEVLGTRVVEDDLAETGPRETVLLLMVAAGCLALGGVSTTLGRRLGLADSTD